MTTPRAVKSPGRAFWLFLSATTTSQIGSSFTTVAFPLVAVSLLGASAFETTMVTAAGFVGWLVLGLPAGVIVQKLPLRRLQVGMDVIRAAAISSVPIAYVFGALTVGQIIVVAAVVSFATVLFETANSTFLPAIVSREDLNSWNSVLSGTQAATQLGGPSLAGVLVQMIGGVGTLLFDVGSYIVSAVLLRRLPERAAPQRPPMPMWASIAEGWHFVRRHPVMFPSMAWATATNFVCGALLALTPLYLVRVLEAPPAVIGLLIASDGLGTLIGAAVTTRLVRRLGGTARAMIIATSVGGLSALLMPAMTGGLGMVLFALGNALFAAGLTVGSVVTRTHRQTESPEHLLARVMATVRFVSWGAVPLGALAAGVLASVLDIHTALWITAVLALAAPICLLVSRVRGLANLNDLSIVSADRS